jgi:hypothetical protein
MPNLAYYEANSELGSQKPPAGAALDREHPMLQGCQFFAPLMETAGLYVGEAISGQLGTLVGADAWSARPGWMVFAGSNSLGLPRTFPDLTRKPQTWLIGLNIPLATANNLALIIQWNSAILFANILRVAYSVVTSPPSLQIAFTWLNNTGNTSLALMTTGAWSSATSPTAASLIGQDVLLAITYDGGLAYAGVQMYLNGVEAPSYTGQQNAASLLAADGLTFLGSNSVAAYNWAACFNRVLSIREIREIAQEPFRPYYTPATAWSGDDAANAAVLYHLAQLCAA